MQNKTSGEKLFDWLYDRYAKQKTRNSWIQSIEYEFGIDDLKFEMILYESSIFMLLRRLLWNTEWHAQKYMLSIVELPDYLESNYLRETFNIKDSSERKHLSELLTRAYDASRSKIPSGLRRTMEEQAEAINERCQLQGCVINYQDKNDGLHSFSLDHIWPLKLGGESQKFNLQTACRKCNSERQNIGDYSDTHYEHFHVKRNLTQDNRSSYWKEFNQFRIGVLTRAGFQCEICGRSITKMKDEVNFIQKNKSENINIFNVMVVCDRHAR